MLVSAFLATAVLVLVIRPISDYKLDVSVNITIVTKPHHTRCVTIRITFLRYRNYRGLLSNINDLREHHTFTFLLHVINNFVS